MWATRHKRSRSPVNVGHPPCNVSQLGSVTKMKAWRLALLICVGCAVGGFAWLRYGSGIQRLAVSPTGEYRAIVRRSPSFSAMDQDIFTVQIRSGSEWGRDLLFQLSGNGIDLELSWDGPEHLNVRCRNCEDAHVDYYRRQWRDVSVSVLSH